MVTPAQSNLINASLAPAALGSAISTAIAGKTLDAARQEGASVLELLNGADSSGEQAVGPGDELVARATGLGGQLDVLA